MTKLTPVERSILINQFRILAALEDDYEGYAKRIEVLASGYETEYANCLEGNEEPLDVEGCEFVCDILWLYYLLKLTRNRDAINDPGGDRDASGRLRLENMEPRFPGFDGNHDAKLLGFANYLIHRDDKFVEHKHYLNSHGLQPNYRRMIEMWESWGRPSDLTDEQADQLLAR